jgi:hypothetical protein
MSGILPPQWPLVSTEDGTFTQPWYGYFKSADKAWRPLVVTLTSVSTAADPAAHTLANHGVTHFAHSGVITTGWILELPTPGVRKTISINSGTTTLVVRLPSTTAFFRDGGIGTGTTGWKLTFPSSNNFKIIDMIGITTAGYYIVSNPSGAVITT